jgi:type IV secretion system protein VirD4
MFDEFTAFGKLKCIEDKLPYIGGYGGKMYMIAQNTNKIEQEYGQNSSIIDNTHIKIAYAPNTIQTAEFLSKMTGKTTIVHKKISLSGKKSSSTSTQETARDLLTPDECSRLPGPRKNSAGDVTAPGDMLIFTAGQPPIYGAQILYFKDPVFLARAKIPAPARSDKISPPAATPAAAVSTAEAEKPTPRNTFADFIKQEAV